MTQPAPGEEDREAMAQLALPLRRQEAQKVHLLADLRHQREDDRGRRPEFEERERR